MRKNLILCAALILIALLTYSAYSQNPRHITSRDLSVLVNASVYLTPTNEIGIKLEWERNELALSYAIRKKKIEESTFPSSFLAELDSNVFDYIDYFDFGTDPFEKYEYEVSAYSYGSVIVSLYDNQGNRFDSTMSFYFRAFGYASASIAGKEYDSPGKVLLLVDEVMQPSIEKEVQRLMNDLVLEGWTVARKNVPRTETFDGIAVRAIKDSINQEFANSDDRLTTVILLGRIAVPYSGRFNPDAHPDHLGAWPADLYYGVMDEWIWTDFSVNDENASRQENRNTPGDGKYDQVTISSSSVDIAIGRIDFYNMPVFVNDSMFTEAQLYKRYLDKNHKYRIGEIQVEMAGLVDDNFSAARIWEGFASSGWRNLASLLGRKNVKSLDWFSILKNDSKLWAYGCGGGTYKSAGGIGETKDFAINPVKTVFTMLFGSYFGDWDSQNNFLRAPLCSDPSALTCAWAGRPHWYFHHMGLGYPIGYSTLISQNNTTTYLPNFYWMPQLFPQYPNGFTYTYANLGVHIALMGDPTLKMFSGKVPPPNNLTAIQRDLNTVELIWEGPAIDIYTHFNVYRSFSKYGPFKRVNKEYIHGNSYVDTISGDKEVYYMVRTSIREFTNSGMFYNQSRGLTKSVVITDVEQSFAEVFNVQLSPNPANAYLDIQLTNPYLKNVCLEIFDLHGRKIRSLYNGQLTAGIHQFAWNLRNDEYQSVPSGVYILKVTGGDNYDIQKIVIMR